MMTPRRMVMMLSRMVERQRRRTVIDPTMRVAGVDLERARANVRSGRHRGSSGRLSGVLRVV